jgi:hypothetical protein
MLCAICSRITSYINNVHPRKHADLYIAIEQVIAHTIPLWNMSLTPLKNMEPYRRIMYYGPVENEDGNDLGIQPEPGKFEPPSQIDEVVDLRNQYGELGLQVIIRLETIHLTPENPKFDEGDWKIEGQLVCELEIASPCYRV